MVDAKYLGTRLRNNAAAAVHTMRSNPTLAAVSAEGFLTRLGFSMVGFALPLYALALGMGIAEVGFLYGLRTATVFAVKPLMGWVADRSGRKRTLVAAVLLRCLIGFLFVFAVRPWHLYVLRILHGAMTAAREPSAAALIAEHGDKRRMASAFAWYSTARDVGRSLGYAVAGLLIQAAGSYRLIFFIAFLSSCAALVTVLRYVRESREVERRPSAPAPDPTLGRRTSYGKLLPYAVFGLMIAASAEMMLGFFPIIATQYAHLTEGQAGIAASVSMVAILVAGPLFGWLSDNVSRNLALGTRSIANTVSSLLYIFFPTFSGFLVARLVDDTGKAAFRPTWGSILAEVSDGEPARRARVITFVDSACTLGEVVAPLLAGFLLSGFGVATMLGFRVVLSMATELQALRVFDQGRTPPERQRLENHWIDTGPRKY